MKQGIATGNTEKPQYQQPMWSNTFLTAQNVHFFSLPTVAIKELV
jgi:hypothetical protein